MKFWHQQHILSIYCTFIRNLFSNTLAKTAIGWQTLVTVSSTTDTGNRGNCQMSGETDWWHIHLPYGQVCRPVQFTDTHTGLALHQPWHMMKQLLAWTDAFNSSLMQIRCLSSASVPFFLLLPFPSYWLSELIFDRALVARCGRCSTLQIKAFKVAIN